MTGKVLVLNQNYEPMTICTVEKAVALMYLGKAELIQDLPDRLLRSVSARLPFPSIVRLSAFVRVPFRRIVLSRKNVLRRDNHRCLYCGRADEPLTIDHVHPRSRGGPDTWENLVAACTRCNNRKGDRTPEEAGMTLLRRPYRPSHVAFIRQHAGVLDEGWKPYLYV